jgi:hypothetical protein
VTFAGLASVGAGAVHAAAMGAHAEHRQAVLAFAATALFQLGWGVLVLARPSARRMAWLGALGNLALVGAWVTAKTVGLGFVAGLEVPEKLQAADTIAAGLALAAFAGVVVAAARAARPGGRSTSWAMGASVVALTALSAYGMVAAGEHTHSHGGSSSQPAAVVPPHPYDPTKPIDLSGVAGVTLEQQARAENLIAITVLRLPKYADPATAEANGFKSIGDGPTGYEHYINWSYVDDDHVLDPDYPESLVYRVRPGKPRELQAVMFMLSKGSKLADAPDIGGKLTQWHIHDNLCFTPDPAAPRVAGLTNVSGQCNPPLVKGASVPMIHVWIVPNPCGPFSALDGLGAGQVAPGEVKQCDHVHGSGSAGLLN